MSPERNSHPYTHVVVLVADGARADVMKRLLDKHRLPNIQRHIVDRGCYKTALTVFPSTTGPAHIPFVCGIHPGTANVPGYRWLDRYLHDKVRRSIYRHRSLNSPRGLLVGRDMDRDKTTSLFEYFDKPASVLELIDYAPNRRLYKIVVRRLLRIIQAHRSDNWRKVDDMVERVVIERLRKGSQCVVGSFFGIDEYSHLYDPFDDRTIGAYLNIDRAVGEIASVLHELGLTDKTVVAIVSDHGLSGTHTHIPLVDIMREHGFDPYHYPLAYKRRRDSAVMESGNAMAALYFKRNEKWGPHWTWGEMQKDTRISRLISSLLSREGVSFVCARGGLTVDCPGITIAGRNGSLTAVRLGDEYEISAQGQHPLGTHPTGRLSSRELFERTFDHTYPDAVNQVHLLFSSPRSGDVAISSEPGYDLRFQYEHPEHHGSHGSLHREHMHVPLMVSIPIVEDRVANYDLVPTILDLCGKVPTKTFDGRVLTVAGERIESTADRPDVEKAAPVEIADVPAGKGNGLTSILITVGIIVVGIVLSVAFKEDIMVFGEEMMTHWGREWVDVALFVITAVSSSPLALPIWAYILAGVALGMSVFRLAVVMALGSATGSVVTFLLGKYFGNRDWVRRRFPNVHRHPWASGKSLTYVTLLLFLGTASPIPCDVLYVACGMKQYPTFLFWINMVAARFVRYMYMGYLFLYGSHFLDKII